MRAVFDLDDTICKHKNRDYKNAEPIQETISKIRNMKEDGWEIIIHTSRGQCSCRGELSEIERKNRKVAEEWLKEYNVPYDELIFGKPIGDIYIDDKGMSLDSFLNEPFCNLIGGSGKTVYRMGNFVLKELGEDIDNYKMWIEDNHSYCQYPKVISYLYNCVTMQYIEGTRLCDDLKEDEFYNLIGIIDGFKEKKKETFKIDEQIKILKRNLNGTSFDKIIHYCIEKLKCYEKSFSDKASFSHGDMTLCNIIKSNKELFFIDPRYNRESSSYLLDFGKLRMSFLSYEKIFKISEADNSKYLKKYDELMKQRDIYREVLTLNLMYICRLYRYKKDKKLVVNMAERLIDECYGMF